VELLGIGGPEGDVELMTLAVSAARASGLHTFVLDLGHADIARALMAECPARIAAPLLDALAHKDSAMVGDLLKNTDVAPSIGAALCELPALHGDGTIWKDAERLLGRTAAAAAMHALKALWTQATEAGLESVLRVDLGEVRGFAYYTGALFHLLAEGPGEPFGSGGRYDDLLARFGAPMPAAGFALDLDNLAWALRASGAEEALESRVLVAVGEGAQAACAALRALGIGCVVGGAEQAPAYASAWGFSHVLYGVDRTFQLVKTGPSGSPPSTVNVAGDGWGERAAAIRAALDVQG
jgi:ATP phosphoribosyltransferase regulatory subunit